MSTEPLIGYQSINDSNENAPNKNNGCGVCFVLLFGCCLAITGGVAGMKWIRMSDRFMIDEAVLTPTSRSYSLWRETPVPTYLKVYLFNWTNPHEFGKVKPNFVQMGPYVFREHHIKVNTVWNDNDTVTYQQNRTWFYEESMSSGSLSDNVTNINFIATTVAHKIRDYDWSVRKMVDADLNDSGETLVVTRTVRELLFDGYENKLQEYAKRQNISMDPIPLERFGWFYSRNGSATYDGTFNMLTGKSNIKVVSTLSSWDYTKKTKYYDGPCGLVNGTTGELWPSSNYYYEVTIFVPEICTSLVLPYETSIKHQELKGYKYTADAKMLDNGTKVPSRACYCKNTKCQPSGVLDISKCRYDAPVFMSQPHFHLADESYREAISGMEPSKKHAFSVAMEPYTGASLQSNIQMQINLLVQPDNAISLFRDVPKIYIPVLWFKEEAALTEDLASQITFVVQASYSLIYGNYFSFIVGLCLLLSLPVGCCAAICLRSARTG